jgi:hypothetical protein
MSQRLKGRPTDNSVYDYLLSRFYRPRQPIASKALSATLWAQVPIFGTVVVPILPVRESDFLEIHGFETRDIARLVDFCKDTGRVQFVLGANPTNYVGYDYLDPILEELKPPFYNTSPVEQYADLSQLQAWATEFDTAGAITFWPMLQDVLGEQGFDVFYSRLRFQQLRNAYLYLNALGYKAVSQRVLDTIVTDPGEAHKILYFYKQFLINPLTDPLKTIPCFSLGYLRLMREVDSEFAVNTEKVLFPSEVGAFLMKQITLVPESFEACRDVIVRFQQQDIIGIVHALGKAVAASDFEVAMARASDLNKILGDIWNESRHYEQRIKGITYGVDLIIGAAGFGLGQIAGGIPGGLMGLLAFLGFKVLDDSKVKLSERLGSQIAAKVSPVYTPAIFDFQKKYNLR